MGHYGLTSAIATAPPFATASQRPPLPPRRPLPSPAFVSSLPAASQIAVPPSTRMSIVHVPSRSQSVSTETSPCRASHRSRSPLQRVSPGSAEVRSRPPERDSFCPSSPLGESLLLAFCSETDCMLPRDFRPRTRWRLSTADCSNEVFGLRSDP